MRKDIKDQFAVIKSSMRMIENSRAREDVSKNKQLLKVWNNTFKWLQDHSKNKYDEAICIAYYGALSVHQCEILTWVQFKKLVNDIMKGEMLL